MHVHYYMCLASATAARSFRSGLSAYSCQRTCLYLSLPNLIPLHILIPLETPPPLHALLFFYGVPNQAVQATAPDQN